MPKRNNLWANIDWFTIVLYFILVFMGWVNIYAASFDPEHQSIFDMSQRYGKQLVWIGAASVIALTILLIDTSFYVAFSYFFYGLMIFLLILVLFVGTEINGARSWFTIGSFRLQPSEFTKFATALALAKYMSSFDFKLKNIKSLLTIALIIGTPMVLILLQNDAGSALVYFAFILVIYREGLSGVVLFMLISLAIILILSLILSTYVTVIILLSIAAIAYFVLNKKFRDFYVIITIFLLTIAVTFSANLIVNFADTIDALFLIGALLGAIISLIYSIRKKLRAFIAISSFLLIALSLSISVDYVFDNFLEEHQQNRINELLGIQSDPLGAGYNVNQSKIAIGSGGFSGKGFLNGTQTKFDFVPEQSTDFIFCTAGEEWGFIGSLVISILFLTLFIRLIFLAERQRSTFSRIYGYSVSVILFLHFTINIGMTIGLMPVIGIPLPFFSYGGSSLWSFTILLFIFLRLDASRLDVISG